jgi:hypothetical protein
LYLFLIRLGVRGDTQPSFLNHPKKTGLGIGIWACFLRAPEKWLKKKG